MRSSTSVFALDRQDRDHRTSFSQAILTARRRSFPPSLAAVTALELELGLGLGLEIGFSSRGTSGSRVPAEQGQGQEEIEIESIDRFDWRLRLFLVEGERIRWEFEEGKREQRNDWSETEIIEAAIFALSLSTLELLWEFYPFLKARACGEQGESVGLQLPIF